MDISSVLIEVTTFCNMKCAGCIRTIHATQNQWDNEHMPLAVFRRIIDTLPPVDEIVLQGVGEPTLHPDLAEMVRYAAQSGKPDLIHFTTNAMARSLAYYGQLFDVGLSRLYVSVDSLDPQLAERLRAGTSVSKLKQTLIDLAARHPRRIAVRTVVGRHNICSIPRLLSQLDGIGCLSVFLHPYDDMGDPHGCLSMDERIAFDRQMLAIGGEYPNLTVKTNFFVPSPDICPHPWRFPAIRADGYVQPCCRMMDKRVLTFGAIGSRTLHEVWGAPRAQQMRADFVTESPLFCLGCPRYEHRGTVVDKTMSLPVL